MIVVVVCLIVSGILLASLLRTALLHDRQLNFEQYRAQAGWLAEAGLERAAARLALSPEYTGESWKIDPAFLGGGDSAVVVIRVEKEEALSPRRKIFVEAVFPSEGPYPARLTRQASVKTLTES
jgi:hypothetical protein